MKLINPNTKTILEVTVRTSDFREIQKAIGDVSFETITPRRGVTLFVDAVARLRSPVPPRFFLPAFTTRRGDPLAIHGTALATGAPGEIVFPTDRRVTGLDMDPRMLGNFVTQRAAAHDPSVADFNFQAILSDERYIAATRVVLATFESSITAAHYSVGLCPCLELHVEQHSERAALALYDEVLSEVGVPDDLDEDTFRPRAPFAKRARARLAA